ncbi:PilZ domain-containing protein [Candidatus Omnitrophota bacterium]
MEERRGSPRWRIERPILIKAEEEQADLSQAVLEDINLNGAKVNLEVPLAVRTRLKLVIDVAEDAAPIFNEGEVIWQKTLGNQFSTGIRFTLFRPADKERFLSCFDQQIRQSWWR